MSEWLIFFSTLGIQILACAYVYGKLSKSVENHDKSIDSIWGKVDNHEQRISHLEGRHR